jgi:hypothetical protein
MPLPMQPVHPSGLPVDQVKNMRAQGLDDNQIIQSLQRDGYTSSQIFDALNQADLVSGAPQQAPTPPQTQAAVPPAQTSPAPPPAQPEPDYSQSYAQPSQPAQDYGPAYSQPAYDQPQDTTNTEELVEAIIEEKWNELLKDINKIIEWKSKTEGKIDALNKRIDDLKASFDKLHQAIAGKLSQYDKNVLNVDAQLKAMEKVFSKILPEFVDSVNKLSKIAGSKKKKSTS